MTNRRQAATVEELEAELSETGARIEAVAVEGDAEEFLRLRMREAALPRLIREARARPVLEEIERLEAERDDLQADAERVRSLPHPPVPQGRRGLVTPFMLHNARIAEADERVRAVDREIEALEKKLSGIEAEGATGSP